MKKILIIEDDILLCDGIAIALRADDMLVFKAHSLKDADSIMRGNSIDLIILDVNLPDGNGFDLLAGLRQESDINVIMLTANDMEEDIIKGFCHGADDYITKPFSLAILRARVNARLRRDEAANIFSHGSYRLDFEKLEFYRGDERIELSRAEYTLLKLLTDNSGITLKRETLIDRIWTDGLDFVEENALSVTVKRLRTKLGSDAPIKTIYGIGYRWGC